MQNEGKEKKMENSRVIKFRAWDGEIMYQDVFFTKGNNRLFSIYQYDHKELCEHVLTIDKDALHLMQYTGLKDKNGKEIYEGDQLEDSILEEGAILTLTSEVYWSEDNACFMIDISMIHDRSCYDMLSDWSQNDMQIIGNIYENPIK